jgi:hypothetical protein
MTGTRRSAALWLALVLTMLAGAAHAAFTITRTSSATF